MQQCGQFALIGPVHCAIPPLHAEKNLYSRLYSVSSLIPVRSMCSEPNIRRPPPPPSERKERVNGIFTPNFHETPIKSSVEATDPVTIKRPDIKPNVEEEPEFPVEPPIRINLTPTMWREDSSSLKMSTQYNKHEQSFKGPPTEGPVTLEYQKARCLSLRMDKGQFVTLRYELLPSTIATHILGEENLLYVNTNSTCKPNFYSSNQQAQEHIETAMILKRGVEIDGQVYSYLGHSRGTATQYDHRSLWFHKGTPEEVWKRHLPKLGLKNEWFDCVTERARRLSMLFTPCLGYTPILDSEIRVVEDITYGGPHNYTEGNGMISEEIAKDLTRACHVPVDEYKRQIPPVLQIRYKYFKGTLTVNKYLTGRQIVFSKAMMKCPWYPSIPDVHPRTGEIVPFDWMGVVDFTRNEQTLSPAEYKNFMCLVPSMPVLEILQKKGVYMKVMKAILCESAYASPLIRAIRDKSHSSRIRVNLHLHQLKTLLCCQSSMEVVNALIPFTSSQSIDVPILPDGQFHPDQPIDKFLLPPALAEHDEPLQWANLLLAFRAVFGSMAAYSNFLKVGSDPTDDELLHSRGEGKHRGVGMYSGMPKKIDTSSYKEFKGEVFKPARRRGQWKVGTSNACKVFAVPEPVLIGDDRPILNADECFLRLTIHGKPRTVVGRVMVIRYPCYHPGDIQELRAIDIPDGRYDHITDTLVASVKELTINGQGKPPLAMRTSGGDYDGDAFEILYDPRLFLRPMKKLGMAKYKHILDKRRTPTPVTYSAVINNMLSPIVHKPGSLHMYWMFEAINPYRGGPFGENCRVLHELFHRSVNNLWKGTDQVRLTIIRKWQNNRESSGVPVFNRLLRGQDVADTFDYTDKKETMRHLLWSIRDPVGSGALADLLADSLIKKKYTAEELKSLAFKWVKKQNSKNLPECALICLEYLDLESLHSASIKDILTTVDQDKLMNMPAVLSRLQNLKSARAKETLVLEYWAPNDLTPTSSDKY
eukprot:CFRG2898T1